MKNKPKLIISDTHAPYHHKYALDHIINIYEEFECDPEIIHLGDLYDFHAISQYTKEPGTPTAINEWKRAKEFVKEFIDYFPKGVLILGNHDKRPERSLKDIGIPPDFLKDWKDLLGLPKGWRIELLYHVIKEWDVLCEHGIGSNGSNGAINSAIYKRCSYIQGHCHSEAGIKYSANHNSVIFGMNTGCLADNGSLAMCYGKYKKKKGVLGCGVVFSGSHAEFIPMEI